MHPHDISGASRPPTASFEVKDVERWLGKGEVAKGRGYRDAVLELDIQDTAIVALVQGTRPKPYRVDIRFRAGAGLTQNPGFHCSCPVGGHCKHAAAVLLRALEERHSPDQLRPEVLTWVQELRKLADSPKAEKRAKQASATRLFYLLTGPDGRGEYRIKCIKARTDNLGRPSGAMHTWTGFERALASPPQFVDEDDQAIVRLLWNGRGRERFLDSLPLEPHHGDEALRRLLASGRWLMDRESRLPWHLGKERPATLAWRHNAVGRMHARIVSEPESARALPLDPPWYLDPVAGEAGVLKLPVPASLVHQLLTVPSLSHTEAQVVAAALADIAPNLPSPVEANDRLRVLDAPAVPILQVATAHIYGLAGYRKYSDVWDRRLFDYAVPYFEYAGQRFAADDKREFVTLDSGETVRIRRDADQ